MTATDSDRGAVISVRTSDAGFDNILRIPVGTYSLKVSAPGFQTAAYPAFALQLNQTARVNVEMKVGQVTETVEVTGSAPVLRPRPPKWAPSSTPARATTASGHPQLSSVDPAHPRRHLSRPAEHEYGIEFAEEGGRPYINGNREQANNFLLDGIDNNQASDNLLDLRPLPTRLGSSTSLPRTPRPNSGTTTAESLTPPSSPARTVFHGDVFEFFRNDIFNANKWENGSGSRHPDRCPAHAEVALEYVRRHRRWSASSRTSCSSLADYQGGRLGLSLRRLKYDRRSDRRLKSAATSAP